MNITFRKKATKAVTGKVPFKKGSNMYHLDVQKGLICTFLVYILKVYHPSDHFCSFFSLKVVKLMYRIHSKYQKP